MDGGRSLAAGTHCEDDGRGTGDGVAAGEDAGARRRAVLVGDQAAAARRLQTPGRPGDQRIRGGAEGHDHGIAGDLELRAFDGDRRAAAAFIGLTEFHPDTLDAAYPSLFVGQDFNGIRKHLEFNAFLVRMVDLLLAGGQLHFGAAVHDGRFGAEAQGGARRVHGDVAAADHHALPAGMDGCEIIGTESLHQVVPGKEFIGGEDPVGVFARNAHETRQTGAGAHEHGLESLLVHQCVDGDGPADDHVQFDLDAEGLDGLNLGGYDLVLRETELGNAVLQHAARTMQGFENRDVVTELGEVRGAGQAGRAGADDGHLVTVGVTLLSTFLIIFCTTMAAWYIARVNSIFCKIIYFLCVFSMVVPFQMVQFTLSQTANKLHLDTPWTIPIIYLGFGAGLAIFMFVGFVKSIPIEIEEAAAIDGCGPVKTYFIVVLPMLRPTIISVSILEIMWIWNDYLLPSLVLDNEKYRTIPIHVQYLKGSYGTIDLGAVMALLLLSIIPVVIFYLSCQKYIIKGVAAGAVKG